MIIHKTSSNCSAIYQSPFNILHSLFTIHHSRFTIRIIVQVVIFAYSLQGINAQSPVQKIFPQGTIMFSNIAYANDTLKKHQLDIYLPPMKNNLPLVVWIHGGAWMLNDKYADMGYMKNTVRDFIDSGYALASIDYRYSSRQYFPRRCRTATGQ